MSRRTPRAFILDRSRGAKAAKTTEYQGVNTMKLIRGLLLCSAMATATSAIAEDFKLPPEVTPALRAACEGDVRRVCVGVNPTYSKVKSCVMANFRSFGARCKAQIALAGLGR
jgi:hypothetical protein